MSAIDPDQIEIGQWLYATDGNNFWPLQVKEKRGGYLTCSNGESFSYSTGLRDRSQTVSIDSEMPFEKRKAMLAERYRCMAALESLKRMRLTTEPKQEYVLALMVDIEDHVCRVRKILEEGGVS